MPCRKKQSVSWSPPKVGNAAEYAKAGADILVTSAPYTARPRDVQVHITAA